MNRTKDILHTQSHVCKQIMEALVSEPVGPDERHFCSDLPDHEVAVLRREHARLRLADLFAPLPAWARQRLACVEAELEVRRGR
jgi:hypothetical protein